MCFLVGIWLTQQQHSLCAHSWLAQQSLYLLHACHIAGVMLQCICSTCSVKHRVLGYCSVQHIAHLQATCIAYDCPQTCHLLQTADDGSHGLTRVLARWEYMHM
ncbi:hypothetical protein COO60DRAFT_1486613 [Scenedesmus sp. NREL 46B-D3]|nr:hypothetical protein COO60DRAFT_1486613 [Scenedesmus sp. NREL 46B-D3]